MQGGRTQPHRSRWVLIVLLAAALTPLAAAAEGETSAAHTDQTLSGDIDLASDLVVGEEDTLRIGPGSTIEGPGRIVVRGALLADGTASAPTRILTGLVFEAGSTGQISGVTFLPPAAEPPRETPPITLHSQGADLTLSDCTFSRLTEALRWEGGAANRLRINGSRFEGATAYALATAGGGDVDVFATRFDGNALAIHATLARDRQTLRVRDSLFQGNGQHLALEVTDAAEPSSRAEILRSDFAALDARVGNAGRGLLLSGSGATSAGGPVVLFAGNRFHDMPVAVRATGPGFTLQSLGDRFQDNGIALHAVDARALLTGTVFEGSREYDVHATGLLSDVELANAQFTEGLLRVAEGNALTANGEAIAAAGAAAATAGALAVGFALFTDAGRQIFARFALLPLYTRLAPSDVLAHEKRKMILDYIAATPGTHMRRIGHTLALSYGTLTYHLYRLEKEGLVTSEDDGLFKRYYVSTGRVKERAQEGPPMITSLRPVERQIYDDIAAHPGSAQSAIAQRLGLSRQALHYHIKKLERAGVIRKQAQGRETLCYPALGPDSGALPAPGDGAKAAASTEART